jgi:hypothetical protein
MPKIVVELPSDRNVDGSIRLEDDAGNVLAGPFPAKGKADQKTASDPSKRKVIADRTLSPNPQRDPTRSYGDTPLGNYRLKGIRVTGTGTKYSADSYGTEGLIALEPTSGQALDAKNNGRIGLAVHGGKPSATGGLRPTNGCIRVSNADMKDLIIALENVPNVVECNCVDVQVSLPGSGQVDPDEGYDEGDPPPEPDQPDSSSSESSSTIDNSNLPGDGRDHPASGSTSTSSRIEAESSGVSSTGGQVPSGDVIEITTTNPDGSSTTTVEPADPDIVNVSGNPDGYE